jgi:NADH-quinone oxidoreductase subunit F
MPHTDFTLVADTLIVTIGDEPDIDYVSSMGLETSGKGTLRVDPESLATNRPAVFAGGDVVTGPDTVVNAIAAGKRAAVMIGRYLRGEELKRPPEVRLPRAYVEPRLLSDDELRQACRAEPPTLPISVRIRSFSEVELALSAERAAGEARRCLRCDLEFTQSKQTAEPVAAGV